jgi:uncharacterized OB-fold protein
LTDTYWHAADQGVLLLQVCDHCETPQLYPGAICRRCWSSSLSWCSSTGLGTVWTFTVAEMPGHAAWRTRAPYCIAIIELDEGPRLLSNVVGCDPYEVRVGLRVRLMEPQSDPDGPPLRFTPW